MGAHNQKSQAGDGLTQALKPVDDPNNAWDEEEAIVTWLDTLPKEAHDYLVSNTKDVLEFVFKYVISNQIDLDQMTMRNMINYVGLARDALCVDDSMSDLDDLHDVPEPEQALSHATLAPVNADTVAIPAQVEAEYDGDMNVDQVSITGNDDWRRFVTADTSNDVVGGVRSGDVPTPGTAPRPNAQPSFAELAQIASEQNTYLEDTVPITSAALDDNATDRLVDDFVNAPLGQATSISVSPVSVHAPVDTSAPAEVVMNTEEPSMFWPMVTIATTALAIVFAALFFAQENYRKELIEMLDIIDEQDAEIAQLQRSLDMNEPRFDDPLDPEGGSAIDESYDSLQETVAMLMKKVADRSQESHALREEIVKLSSETEKPTVIVDNATLKAKDARIASLESQLLASKSKVYSEDELTERVQQAVAQIELPTPLPPVTIEVPGPERVVTNTIMVQVPTPVPTDTRIVYRDPPPSDKIYSEAEMQALIAEAIKLATPEDAVADELPTPPPRKLESDWRDRVYTVRIQR